MTRALAALVALAAVATPAAAQNQNLQRVVNDSYTRSHDYDLVHQRIALRDFDWDSTSFKGVVSTTLLSLRPALDSVVLDAGEQLTVTSATSASGATLRTAHHGDTLVVFLAKPAAFRESVRFTLAYDGKVTNGRGLTFIDARAHSPRQLWSQGEDTDNHFWFPTYDFPNDKMTWEIEATVPAGFTAIANGALASDRRNANGTHTVTWSQPTPSATYLASLIVAPLAKVHDSWKGVPVDYYVYRQDSSIARALFNVTPDMIDVYSTLTGVAYPWKKYAQTTVADFFGGMENVSATTLVDWIPDANAYQDRPWFQYILIAHELAHQWFGDYVTTNNFANMWLNEGFAEYMPGQYWLKRKGVHMEQDYYLDEYRQFMAIDAQARMPLAAAESNNIYPKGALVLQMLKQYLGEQRFWAGVNRYLTHHQLGTAVTDDLRQDFLDATGENLDWFFDEWMYSAGYPEFTVTSSYDAAARRVTMIVEQSQRDSMKPNAEGLRFTVPEAFRMPVSVKVRADGREVMKKAWISQRTDTIVIDGIGTSPTQVVFDPENQVLKKLTFVQPTPQLVAQLRTEPNLWNRQWVITQLASRTNDAAATAAIAEAATQSDYFLTRQLAATTLGGLPAAIATPALARAMRDTSSQVRKAAITAFGRVGGDAALAAARDAWRNDRSYEVRAAALTVLSRLDTAGAHALVLAGIGTPSYRDVIANAAMAAAVRLGDSTFVAPLQAQVGEQSRPSYTLAAFAARGDPRAMVQLRANMNDSRAWVRQWTLAAVTRTLDATKSREFLGAVQQSLTHADTKAAVARALARLSAAPSGSNP
ncbi:MAG: hypothetical protein JWO05_3323 [Gemmatimonadetes bacterium]|nr:hypothetical protein [Gemmatimonadota bacterium]